MSRLLYSEGMEDRSAGGSGDTGGGLQEDWRANFRQTNVTNSNFLNGGWPNGCGDYVMLRRQETKGAQWFFCDYQRQLT